MLPRHETVQNTPNLWAELAAPLAADAVVWRRVGAPMAKDTRAYALFAPDVRVTAVRERLDAITAGEWDCTLDRLDPMADAAAAARGVERLLCAFKARIQILGVIREDVGTGRDYLAAAERAYVRAAQQFGIGAEWRGVAPVAVEVATLAGRVRPIEPPAVAYARRLAREAQQAARLAQAVPSEALARDAERTERAEQTARTDRPERTESTPTVDPVQQTREQLARLPRRTSTAA